MVNRQGVAGKIPTPKVIVVINNGVAELLCKPKGVGLAIYDYDVEGTDENDPSLKRDSGGKICFISEWDPAQEVLDEDVAQSDESRQRS